MLFIPEFKIIYVYRELKNVLAPDKVKVNDPGSFHQAMFYMHTYELSIYIYILHTCACLVLVLMYMSKQTKVYKMHNT